MEKALEKEKIEFENALKQRNFEIDLFWKRSWFFGALIIAEIATFYKVKTEPIDSVPPVVIAFITALTVLAQCLMNRGSKYWQERWEYMTMNREAALGIELTRLRSTMNKNQFSSANVNNDKGEWFYIDASIIHKDTNILAQSRRFSVSKITFLVWDLIFLCSLMSWFYESFQILSFSPNWKLTICLVVFYSVICGYIIVFLRKGNVYEHYNKETLNLTERERAELNKKYVNNQFE